MKRILCSRPSRSGASGDPGNYRLRPGAGAESDAQRPLRPGHLGGPELLRRQLAPATATRSGTPGPGSVPTSSSRSGGSRRCSASRSTYSTVRPGPTTAGSRATTRAWRAAGHGRPRQLDHRLQEQRERLSRPQHRRRRHDRDQVDLHRVSADRARTASCRSSRSRPWLGPAASPWGTLANYKVTLRERRLCRDLDGHDVQPNLKTNLAWASSRTSSRAPTGQPYRARPSRGED